MKLAALQNLFQDRLLTGDDAVTAHLARGGRFLGVYDHAYEARLIEVLEEDFPATRAALGETAFAEAARSYVHAHPSTSRSIRWIGSGFADWLAEPALAALAAYEWALGLAFDAPDAKVLDRDELAALDPALWPALSLRLHPSVSMLALAWDVVAFRQDLDDAVARPGLPRRLQEPVTLAVWREPVSHGVRVRPLGSDEAAALRAIDDGATFARMCDVLAEAIGSDGAPSRAAGLVGAWLADGWLAGLELDRASLG